MEQTKPSPSEDAVSAVRQTPRRYISVRLQELRQPASTNPEYVLAMRRGRCSTGPQNRIKPVKPFNLLTM